MVADCKAESPPAISKIIDSNAIKMVQNNRCHKGEFSVSAVK